MAEGSCEGGPLVLPEYREHRDHVLDVRHAICLGIPCRRSSPLRGT
jgi:hypothetical protein